MVTLDIIIVNWNSRGELKACLQTIPPACQNSFTLTRVVVVDNASSDASADGLEEIPIPLTVIRNRENRGFAAACNQGARGSQGKYLLFLNPDTRLFEDSLAKPLAFMERPENHNVGTVSIQLVDQQGIVSRVLTSFPTPTSFMLETVGLNGVIPRRLLPSAMIEWDHLTTCEVDQVTGAFFVVRRPLFESLGGFDERFFMYWEDVDFCLGARRAGWSAFFIGEARAFHKVSGSADQIKPTRLFYFERSRIQYAYKHFGWWSGTGILLAELFVAPFLRLVKATALGSVERIKSSSGGTFLLWKALPGIFRDIQRFGPANRARIPAKSAPNRQGQ